MGKPLKKAQERLERRIHGGDGTHRAGKCGCDLWLKKGYRKPGSMKK
jgi:hypothetical protein